MSDRVTDIYIKRGSSQSCFWIVLAVITVKLLQFIYMPSTNTATHNRQIHTKHSTRVQTTAKNVTTIKKKTFAAYYLVRPHRHAPQSWSLPFLGRLLGFHVSRDQFVTRWASLLASKRPIGPAINTSSWSLWHGPALAWAMDTSIAWFTAATWYIKGRRREATEGSSRKRVSGYNNDGRHVERK